MSRRVMIFLGACILGLAAVVTSAYRRDISASYRRISSGSDTAKTACGPIEYAALGDGPPVLMVHGAGGGFDQGIGFGSALTNRGMRVIAVSRFGYLGTPLPADASAEAQADAHACLLDALGIEKAVVVGASAGAPSAMQLALRHPDRVGALILLVPAIYAPRPGYAPPMLVPRWTEFLFSTALKSDFVFWAARQVAPGVMISAILATPPDDLEKVSPSERQRVAEILDGILPVKPRRLGLLNDAAITSRLPRYDLERISSPALLVSVADDQFGTFQGARYSAQHIPNSRFIGYATGGHIWAGHHDDLLREISSFIRSQSSDPISDR